jgi:DNA-binding transcriptional ArsR family regulator
VEGTLSSHEVVSELLPLLKALADKNRLKIVGLLSQRPHAVEDLARALHLSPSTVSHHLSVLGRADLVAGRSEGYYNIYSLRTESLHAAAKRLLHRDQLREFAEPEAGDPFRRKVLATFTTPGGRIKSFPMQEKKFLVLVEYVLKAFEHGTRYTEKRVNEILGEFSDDTARLRRALVDHRYMQREGGGGKYWRIR